MSALYNYMEPFSAECRAFGRLQESGHEELSVRCFGYVLLDDEHERAMMAQCNLGFYTFNGGGDHAGFADDPDLRMRFPGKNGKPPPPLRCIVKAFGQGIGGSDGDESSFRQGMARRVLRDIIKLQKLGIIQVDVAIRQLIDGKLSDFSTAITMPHFITNPELNPNLTSAMVEAMRKVTFEHCMNDYLDFDCMIRDWNTEYGKKKGRMSIHAYPGRGGCYLSLASARYNLRSKKSTRKSLYTFVDPRKYGWIKGSASDSGPSRAPISKRRQSGRVSKNVQGKADQVQHPTKPTPRRLTARPDMWYYDYKETDRAWADSCGRCYDGNGHSIFWSYKDGHLFPYCDARRMTLGDSPPRRIHIEPYWID